MNLVKRVISECVLCSLVCISTVTLAYAQNAAEGSLTVDGEKAAITHVYADIFDGDITIVLTSETIPISLTFFSNHRTQSLGLNNIPRSDKLGWR